MRIAFYATTILEHGGGLETYFIETANNLSARPGWQADIITRDDKFTEKIARILGCYYFKKIVKSLLYKETPDAIASRLGRARYYKCKGFKELKEKLGEYDLVYSKNELLEAFILKFCVGYRNIPPVVFGCHTPVHYPVADSLQSKFHNFFYSGFVYKWLANGVAAFHVTNNADRARLENIFPGKRVFKIYNPFHLSQFASNLKAYTYDFTWHRERYNILWLARLTEQKGVLSLARIINVINQTDLKDKVIFNIVGNGSLDQEIVKLQKKWDNVNWFGYVEYRYLPSIYGQNDLFLSTSQWEAFGLNILEAQASGLPAIAFDIPGPQDIIQDGKSGFLVRSEEEFCRQIKACVTGETVFVREEINQNVNQVFSPEAIYAELAAMFAEVAERHH